MCRVAPYAEVGHGRVLPKWLLQQRARGLYRDWNKAAEEAAAAVVNAAVEAETSAVRAAEAAAAKAAEEAETAAEIVEAGSRTIAVACSVHGVEYRCLVLEVDALLLPENAIYIGIYHLLCHLPETRKLN